jgi:superfamily II DNA helicase RecQ
MATLCDCSLALDGLGIPEMDACVGHRKLKEALQGHFKFNTFRPGQLEALLPVVHGKDVFVRMPTGGGKSLCMFLVPLAVNKKAIGVIVSPLVSLMDQQVSTFSLACMHRAARR